MRPAVPLRHFWLMVAGPTACRRLRAGVVSSGRERRLDALLLDSMSIVALGLRQLTRPVSVLLVAAALAWAGVVVLQADMGPMPGTMGLGAVSFLGVWTLMMAAMMLPSVTPFASLYARGLGHDRGPRVAAFASGYMLAWALAALPAYGLAWYAGRLVGHHPAGATTLAVIIFAACGAYQLTPLKDHCLANCRSPVGFLLKYGGYRAPARDLRVGLHHGAFCLACCWALMGLLVAFGLMNLLAMTALAAAVLIEKTWPWGPLFSRVLGVAALGLAIAVVFEPAIAPGLHHASTGMGSM